MLLVSKENGEDIKVKINNLVIGGKDKIFIAGPCSIEDYETMHNIALELKKIGVHILRGGAFKPRTSPYDFQGLQYEGLEILRTVSRSVDLPVATEIMDTRDVEIAMEYTDIIQIGSRNMYNYSLLKEVGKQRIPVILKRGMSATINEWVKAAEYIMNQGNENIIMCERGIRTFEDYTRNTLDLNAVAVLKEEFRLPVIVDPSHGTGRRELIKPMSKAAVAAGADGLMIECHTNPDCALSDAAQTVSIECIKEIQEQVKRMSSIL